MVSWPPLLLPLQTGFSQPWPHTGCWTTLCCEGRGCPGHCAVFSRLLGLCLPGARDTPLPNPDNPKCLQTLPEVPRETESHLVEKRCPRQSAPSGQGSGLPSSLLHPKVLNLRKYPSDARGHCRGTRRARHPGVVGVGALGFATCHRCDVGFGTGQTGSSPRWAIFKLCGLEVARIL